MSQQHPEEGTLNGLLALMTERFDGVTGFIDAGGSGETLVVQFTEQPPDSRVDELEEFFTGHGARFTDIPTEAQNVPNIGIDGIGFSYRVVMEDRSVDWGTEPDTKVVADVDLKLLPAENIANPDEFVNTITVTQKDVVQSDRRTVKYGENGCVQRTITEVNISEVRTRTVDTFFPVSDQLKTPPTVVVEEYDAFGTVIATHEITEYDRVGYEDDEVEIEHNGLTKTITAAAVREVKRESLL